MKTAFLAVMFYLISSFFSVSALELPVLKIEANQTNYVLGEPVVLYVSLQNVSDEVLELPYIFAPIAGFVDYHIKQLEDIPDRLETRFNPTITGEPLDPQKNVLPGERVVGEARIFYGAEGWIFERPGTYEITAQMFRGLLSSTETITINTPTDEETAKAAELFLESDGVGFFLFYGGSDVFTISIQQLKQVMTECPNTPHATYANIALGTNFLHDSVNDIITGNIRAADPASALPFLERAKQKPISFYDILYTHMSLYEAHTQLNNLAEAKSTLKDLVQIASTQFEDYLPFLEYIFEYKGIQKPEITQTSCLLYAVHDQGQKENQFFTVNLAEEDFEVKPLELKHHGHDISLATADFDGDGLDEMVMATKQGGHTVTLYELDGTEIRSFPVEASGISLAAGDINGDGTPEIIVASRASNSDSVFVYATDGTAVDSIALFDKNTRISPAVGDIDGDNRTDIIAGRLLKADQVAVYNSVSQERRHFSVFQSVSHPGKKSDKANAKGITYGVQVASDDLNEDGNAEMVAAMANHGSQIEIYSSDGTRLKAFSAFDSQDGVVLTVGNVVNDGQPEIIVGEAKGRLIRGFNMEGEQLFEFQAVAKGDISSMATFRCENP